MCQTHDHDQVDCEFTKEAPHNPWATTLEHTHPNMVPHGVSVDMGLELAERWPDGTPATKSIISQDKFMIVNLDGRWEAVHMWKILLKEDEEYVRDSPEDVSYEVNRQRYLMSKLPTNKKERIVHFIPNAPSYLTSCTSLASQAADAAIASISDRYAEECAAGVARSAFSSGLSVD